MQAVMLKFSLQNSTAERKHIIWSYERIFIPIDNSAATAASDENLQFGRV